MSARLATGPSVTSSLPRATLGQSEEFVAAARVARQNLNVLIDRLGTLVAPSEPARLAEFERELQIELAQRCGDVLTAAAIQEAHNDEVVKKQAQQVQKGIPDLKPQRPRKRVVVTLLGGSAHTIETPYYLRRPPRGPGRPRGRGRRGKPGNGEYPVLAAIGINNRVSPAVAMEVARLVCMSTYSEAQESLAQRGLKLDIDTVANLAHRLAARGLEYRKWAIERVRQGFRGTGQVKDKRIAIATDGGRLRTREVKRKGRRRKSGRRGFNVPWREPKVLTVYEIDEKGKLKCLLRYDATLGNADDLFEILKTVLAELGAHEAAEWIVLGDGADWIWNRLDQLVQDLGYDRSKVTEVVDFYHAVDHLAKILDLVNGWSSAQRRKWFKQAKRLIKLGDIAGFLQFAAPLKRGRNAKKIRKALAYYSKRQDRMRYAHFKKRGIPIGSGVVESAVRRIVNLRLKGSSIFWAPDNAEGLLHLRAQLLSGRWYDYCYQILKPVALWAEEKAA